LRDDDLGSAWPLPMIERSSILPIAIADLPLEFALEQYALGIIAHDDLVHG
jgi:hypothetical protein